MTCEACGAAVGIEDSDGATNGGRFLERYECANGHTGRVRGESSAPPSEWKRTGPVFNA